MITLIFNEFFSDLLADNSEFEASIKAIFNKIKDKHGQDIIVQMYSGESKVGFRFMKVNIDLLHKIQHLIYEFDVDDVSVNYIF